MVFFSCGRKGNAPVEKIITVSIGPFKYFVEAIAGNEYTLTLWYQRIPISIFMSLSGSGGKVQKSVAYISNGFWFRDDLARSFL